MRTICITFLILSNNLIVTIWIQSGSDKKEAPEIPGPHEGQLMFKFVAYLM